MDDSFLVRRFKGFGNLPRDTECFLDWDGSTLSQPLGQCWTLDKFENQRVSIARLFEAIDCANTRMIEGGQRAGFLLESAHPVRIVGQGGRQYLNCDVTPQFCVVRPVDFTHSARTEQGYKFVGTDARADP